jgi:hypothetical protein
VFAATTFDVKKDAEKEPRGISEIWGFWLKPRKVNFEAETGHQLLWFVQCGAKFRRRGQAHADLQAEE